MRVELSSAILLHRRTWRDTSVLVEALSREHGRIGLIAKGAQRPKSRWRGLLEPLATLQLSWGGRGELYTLTGIEPGPRRILAGKQLMSAFYASELVLRLIARDDPHPSVYDSLAALLDTLDQGAPAVLALRFFERDLLDEIGYGVPLTATSDTDDAIVANARYRYHPDRGLRRAAGNRPHDEIEVTGSALLGLAAGRFQRRTDVRNARDLMQAAIAPHLGNRPLKSVQTQQAMRQFAADDMEHSNG